jgi:hypothetical protein
MWPLWARALWFSVMILLAVWSQVIATVLVLNGVEEMREIHSGLDKIATGFAYTACAAVLFCCSRPWKQ